MKTKLFKISLFFLLFPILFIGILNIYKKTGETSDSKAEHIVALNEIKQLAKLAVEEDTTGRLAILEAKIEELQDSIRRKDTIQVGSSQTAVSIVLCVCWLLFVTVVFGYVYFAILRPFDKMKAFAQKIAEGEFDLPLDYERSNYFGEFTWAFDSMRREITKARSCEREAIENNKTIIATLSHDIKTPIASIRAYAEGLQANLDKGPEKRGKYLDVIMRKCDEVAKLTDDLFLHSISDLDKLKINMECFEICGFLGDAIGEIEGEQEDVYFVTPGFKAEVMADKNRLIQIAENLMNNSRKYAKTRINISMELFDGNVLVHFKDYGGGIPDEDMPFIFDKFYRGRNCGREQGSGLGLYIVKYIAQQMNGKILLNNHVDGFEAVLMLPIK